MKKKKQKCPVCGREIKTAVSGIYCSPTCETLDQQIEQMEDRLKPKKHSFRRRKYTETVANDCKHENCCHRGHIGGVPCCDYILHMGEVRPNAISDCPGYEQRIVKKDTNGKVVEKYASAKAAAEAAGVSTTTMMNHLKTGKKHTLKGYYYVREQFNAKIFVEKDFANDNFFEEKIHTGVKLG